MVAGAVVGAVVGVGGVNVANQNIAFLECLKAKHLIQEKCLGQCARTAARAKHTRRSPNSVVILEGILPTGNSASGQHLSDVSNTL